MRNRSVTRRSLGGDAVYCAAYRGGRALWNERTGDLYKWNAREDVRDVGIVLPQALANDTEYQWAKDPYKLWNTAEFSEIAKNARVARDYMMILPKELSQEQRRDVVYRFAQTLADRYGNAIDVALHDERKGRARYFHAHLLATTRKIGPEGLLQKTDAEITSGTERKARGLTHSYKNEHQQVRALWERMLKDAVREAQLPRHVYYDLYKEYGRDESTTDYHKRLIRQGFDLRAQQREDRRKTLLTPEERRQAAEKKWILRKDAHMQRKERQRRQALNQRLRKVRWSVPDPDRYKILWLPRWDAKLGLLNPHEIESQKRRRGQTQAMVSLQIKADPGPEPAYQPEPEQPQLESKPKSKKIRPARKEDGMAQPENTLAPALDPVRRWLAYRQAHVQPEQSRDQAIRRWVDYRRTHKPHLTPATDPVRDWVAYRRKHQPHRQSEAQSIQNWLAYRHAEQQRQKPGNVYEQLFFEQLHRDQRIRKKSRGHVRQNSGYELER